MQQLVGSPLLPLPAAKVTLFALSIATRTQLALPTATVTQLALQTTAGTLGAQPTTVAQLLSKKQNRSVSLACSARCWTNIFPCVYADL